MMLMASPNTDCIGHAVFNAALLAKLLPFLPDGTVVLSTGIPVVSVSCPGLEALAVALGARCLMTAGCWACAGCCWQRCSWRGCASCCCGARTTSATASGWCRVRWSCNFCVVVSSSQCGSGATRGVEGRTRCTLCSSSLPAYCAACAGVRLLCAMTSAIRVVHQAPTADGRASKLWMLATPVVAVLPLAAQVSCALRGALHVYAVVWKPSCSLPLADPITALQHSNRPPARSSQPSARFLCRSASPGTCCFQRCSWRSTVRLRHNRRIRVAGCHSNKPAPKSLAWQSYPRRGCISLRQPPTAASSAAG
jgi:hypothetical protein